jgi:hypothetical protein
MPPPSGGLSGRCRWERGSPHRDQSLKHGPRHGLGLYFPPTAQVVRAVSFATLPLSEQPRHALAVVLLRREALPLPSVEISAYSQDRECLPGRNSLRRAPAPCLQPTRIPLWVVYLSPADKYFRPLPSPLRDVNQRGMNA